MLTKRTDPAVTDAYIKARTSDTEAAKRVSSYNKLTPKQRYDSLVRQGYSPSEARTISEDR